MDAIEDTRLPVGVVEAQARVGIFFEWQCKGETTTQAVIER